MTNVATSDDIIPFSFPFLDEAASEVIKNGNNHFELGSYPLVSRFRDFRSI